MCCQFLLFFWQYENMKMILQNFRSPLRAWQHCRVCSEHGLRLTDDRRIKKRRRQTRICRIIVNNCQVHVESFHHSVLWPKSSLTCAELICWMYWDRNRRLLEVSRAHKKQDIFSRITISFVCQIPLFWYVWNLEFNRKNILGCKITHFFRIWRFPHGKMRERKSHKFFSSPNFPRCCLLLSFNVNNNWIVKIVRVSREKEFRNFQNILNNFPHEFSVAIFALNVSLRCSVSADSRKNGKKIKAGKVWSSSEILVIHCFNFFIFFSLFRCFLCFFPTIKFHLNWDTMENGEG